MLKRSRFSSGLLAAAVAASISAWGGISLAAEPAKASPPSVDESGASDKLDVSGLEKKYWAAKDTDFSVVQNRTYSKAGRFALTGQYGYYVNDSYNDVQALRLAGDYYFNERYGVELDYEAFSAVNSQSTNAYLNSNGGVMPNHNQPQTYYGAAFNWVPIYAKMSLLNSRIIYFDMAFSPGFGISTSQQQLRGAYPTTSAPTFSFNISQHFFLSNWFALRFDFQNRWYNDEIKDFRTTQVMSNSLYHESSLMGGVQFFF